MIDIRIGDCREVLKTLEPESVNCVVTSPPYWGLRDYGTEPLIWGGDPHCEHEWSMIPIKEKSHENEGFNERGGHSPGQKKQEEMKEINASVGFCQKCGAWKGQLGLEPTPELYTKHLCDIFDHIKRVLRKDGTCWVVMGDTYAGSWGNYGSRDGGQRPQSVDKIDRKGVTGPIMKVPQTDCGIPSKSLVQIPSRFSIEMVNRGWILRNEIIWHKPSCMPSSAKDRFTIDFEKIFFFTKSQKYWFEQQFETPATSTLNNMRYYNNQFGRYTFNGKRPENTSLINQSFKTFNPMGRNKRTVWTIPTKPYSEAHFATFPLDLIETPIKAGCPKEVCKKCGIPREPIWGKSWDKPVEKVNRIGNLLDWKEIGASRMNKGDYPTGVHYKLVGYTDCGCDAGFRPGIVLDPFGGSGTVGEFCRHNGYDAIIIEVNPEYKPLIEDRTLAKIPHLEEYADEEEMV